MHLTLPCLIFANVVPAFEPHNVKALGPLVTIAFGYHAIGFILGLVIRELCYVPRNFWQGLVVLCTMSNWASLRECYAHHN
jgi:predicted permease